MRLRIAVLEILIEEMQAARAEYARATGKKLRILLTKRFLDVADLFDHLVCLPWGFKPKREKLEKISK